jgi:hypothetical protein
VTLATTISVLKQDRREFESLLGRALEFDPDRDPAQRLVTIVLQRKARALLDHEDEFFVDESAPPDTTQIQEK